MTVHHLQSWLVSAVLLLLAAIHLLPVAGAFGPDQLTTLYGVNVGDPNLEILLRHRAVLFGLLGLLCSIAAFVRSLRWLAVVAALISVGSFLWFDSLIDPSADQIARVVIVDWVALVAAVVAAALLVVGQRDKP